MTMSTSGAAHTWYQGASGGAIDSRGHAMLAVSSIEADERRRPVRRDAGDVERALVGAAGDLLEPSDRGVDLARLRGRAALGSARPGAGTTGTRTRRRDDGSRWRRHGTVTRPLAA